MAKLRVTRVGCLLIDEPLSGENALSGLSLPPPLRAFSFRPEAGARVWERLQALLYQARSACDETAILARGAGCGAALALAEQLPVDRLALIEPAAALRGGLDRARRGGADTLRQLKRINAFARRNLSLCVSETLVVEDAHSRGFRLLSEGGLATHGRLFRLCVQGEIVNNLYTNCENGINRAIINFLRDGDLRKDLAENPEMCIIYE